MKDDIVWLIEARPGFELKLDELVTRLGPPQVVYPYAVLPADTPRFFYLTLYYPEKGLVLYTAEQTYELGAGLEYTVAPEFLVDKVLYFEPQPLYEIVTSIERRYDPEHTLRHAYPWRGFGRFPY